MQNRSTFAERNPPAGGRSGRNGVGARAVSLAALLSIVLVSLTVAPAGARRHGLPSTGLPNISYGRPAPEFTFDRDGTATSLAAFAGRPVVLNFWATWCEPCADELPVFARLRSAYGGDVVLIAVSGESREVTAPFLSAHGVDALAVADPERVIFDRYSVTPLPVTLVLDRNGIVTHVSVGELDWPELQTAVAAASSTLGSPAAAPR